METAVFALIVLAVGSWRCARHGDWVLAGTLAAIACFVVLPELPGAQRPLGTLLLTLLSQPLVQALGALAIALLGFSVILGQRPGGRR